ncbi:MAG: hypothetical protein RL215_3382, partial [Planctomycetota bacterium]
MQWFKSFAVLGTVLFLSVPAECGIVRVEVG